MSMLRKAREKAREGIRAVNTERKKHFGSQAASRARGAPAQPSLYNYRQMKQSNEAFEAILDDETELFGMEPEYKPESISSNDHLASVDSVGTSSQSQRFDDDLFSDDFETPPSEAHDHESPPINIARVEEVENDESISSSDVTQKGSPLQPHLQTSDRSSQDGESEELLLNEPQTTESASGDTLETQGNTTVETSEQGSVKEEEHVTLGAVDHLGNATVEAEDQSQVQDTLESEHEDKQPPELIDPSDKQDEIPQDDLFSDTFSTTVGDLPSSEDTLAPSTDTINLPVTPLSSSFEDDHHLSPSAASTPDKSRDARGVSSERSDDELTSTTALLEELLSPKSRTDSHPLQVPVPPVAHESSHLDSGIFDNESHKRSLSEDFFETSEERHKGVKGTSFTSPGVSPHKSAVKRNSTGKLPPTRPPISPNVRRKLSEKSAKKDRVPADDLFVDDFVAVPSPNQSKPIVPPRPSVADVFNKSTPPPDSQLDKQEATQNVAVPSPSQSKPIVPPRPSVADISNKFTPSPNSQLDGQEATQNAQSKSSVTEDTGFKRQDSHMLDEPELTLPYHLILALTVYIYYSLSPWSYLSGFLAGFLTVYLLVGTVFVWYVVTQEHEKKIMKREKLGPSTDFLRRMDTNFDDVRNYQVR